MFGLCADVEPREGFGRPRGKIFVQQAEIKKPFTGVVDDIQMYRAQPLETGQETAGLDPQGQPQFRNRARARRPIRRVRGQFGKMVLKIKARQCVIRLRLQIGGCDPRRGNQARHAGAVHQVGNKAGDKHGFACARQARDPKTDHWIGKR